MIDIAAQPHGSQNRLFERLTCALSPEALDAARDVAVEMMASTIYAPARTQHAAGTTFLLLLDALNANRDERARELRWRRFITIASSFQPEIRSHSLRDLIAENADLIATRRANVHLTSV